jgi:dihydroneopterin aldolase
MGKILIEDMQFYAYHGCTDEEKLVGIHFTVDVEISCNLEKPANSDDINNALNYQDVYLIVKKEMEQTSNLIENVGKRIKESLLNKFSEIENIVVKVSKINPPLGGKVKKVSIIL